MEDFLKIFQINCSAVCIPLVSRYFDIQMEKNGWIGGSGKVLFFLSFSFLEKWKSFHPAKTAGSTNLFPTPSLAAPQIWQLCQLPFGIIFCEIKFLSQTGQKLVQKWFCENLGTALLWFSHFVLFPWLKSFVRRGGYFAPMTLSMAWGQSGQTLAPWSSNPSPSTTSNCHLGSRFSRFVDVSKRGALFQTYLEKIYVLGSRSICSSDYCVG